MCGGGARSWICTEYCKCQLLGSYCWLEWPPLSTLSSSLHRPIQHKRGFCSLLIKVMALFSVFLPFSSADTSHLWLFKVVMKCCTLPLFSWDALSQPLCDWSWKEGLRSLGGRTRAGSTRCLGREGNYSGFLFIQLGIDTRSQTNFPIKN